MNLLNPQSKFLKQAFHAVIAALLVWSSPTVRAQQAPPDQSQENTTSEEAPTLSADQLDSLVAPIALYSDSLLAQTLAASTYPLEIIQLQQWMDKNKNLKDKALADAVAKQPWDPSVQALVPFPDVVQRMAENVQWTTDLGNAFLAQQSDVMDAVQRMRGKAQSTGNLKTSAQQTVQTKTVEGGKQVVEIQPANPDTVYVPSYDPTVVYGAAPAAAPYYDYTYPEYRPGSALAWGAGVAVSAAAWGSWANTWGNCDWNHGDVTINNNNNFNKNYNKNVNKGAAAGQGNNWQHNPQHRGNAPYANKQTANKYGGKAAGATGAGARATGGKPAGGGAGAKPGGVGAPAARPAGGGAGAKPGGGGAAAKSAGGGAGAKAGGGGGAAKAAGGGAGAKSAKGGGGANKVGNHSVSSGSSGNALGGAGAKGSSAKAASSRGGASVKGGGGGHGGGAKAGGGGGGRGGGGHGGGGKGGGGRRR